MKLQRPVLRYHGGKWRLASWIISHFPPHRVYVEPFGGAASVLLRKPRSYAEVYNDLDGEIVNLFEVLRDEDKAEYLRRQLELTPYSHEEFELSYEPVEDEIEQARRTIVRSFLGFGSASVTGYNTGFRANSNRSGTTPAHDWANYPDNIPVIARRLQGVVIENRPAIEVIQQQDSAETLHYVDPPYPLGVRNSSMDAYRYEMSDDNHRELGQVLHEVQGMVIVSGYACRLYDEEIYPDWRRVTHNALADGASKRTEVLWISPRADSAALPLFHTS